MRNASRRFMVWGTWSQLVVLFGEVMEPAEGGALLGEGSHWGWLLMTDSLPLLPVPSLFFLGVKDNVTSHSPGPAGRPCLSCHNGLSL